MNIDYDASQVRDLAIDLGRFAAVTPGEARKAIRETAEEIKAAAKAAAPVDTGALRDSISYETRETAGGAEAEIGPTVWYSHFLEYGTARMGPRPFLGPALDRYGNELEKRLGDVADRLDREL